MKTYVLDIDDASVLGTRWDLLLKLKEFYPNLKVTLFWIPYDYKLEMGTLRIMRKERLRQLQENKDWIEIAPHGIVHYDREFEKADRIAMEKYLDSIEGELAKDGITPTKLFKAPQWLWNQDVVDVLNERGWAGAIDRNQPNMLKTKKFYKYSHSMEEPFWLDSKDLIKLHGHMSLPSINNIDSCFLNLMKMPHEDIEFKFASEFIENE